jgi:hypothetical protein
MRAYLFSLAVVVACGKHESGSPQAKVEATTAAASAGPAAAPAAGSLAGFAPAKLAGLARTNLALQPTSVAAAYQTADGSYANLAFAYADPQYEAGLAKLCKSTEQVAGFSACVTSIPDLFTVHWLLPNQISADISAPDEKLARQMAGELALAKLAALARR